jgi:hypothetical protein
LLALNCSTWKTIFLNGKRFTTTTFRNGVVVLAKFNTKCNRVDALIYANNTQATKRAAELRAIGINASTWRSIQGRAVYVQIVPASPIIDAQGHEHRACAFCNADCSTHPDAGNPLSCCGDCGKPTCPDHRVEDDAERCVDCASVFYR